MRVNVSKILKKPSGATSNHEVTGHIELDDGVRQIHGSVKLLRVGNGLWVRSTLSSIEQTTCSRCLKEYTRPFEVVIDEEAQLKSTSSESEGECLNIDGDNILDLTEAVRQYCEIASPMKMLCGSDCKGICIVCGNNQNGTTCNCEKGSRDPRWDALIEAINT